MNKQQKCINKFVLIQEALGKRWVDAANRQLTTIC